MSRSTDASTVPKKGLRKGLEKGRLLILSVDRDDDVGTKAKIRTPIVGRRACIAAATKMAIVDPEEADANAIFAAIRQYDDLVEKRECEVAVIAGSSKGGVGADQKLRSELMEVLQKFRADGAVLVSDGFTDKETLPIILSSLPIVSVQRVVIKHSESVEESYAVLGRYLRMFIFDPRYSRFVLGLPGLVLLVAGLLFLFNMPQLALMVIMTILGGALVIRGFDVDKRLEALKRMKPSSYIRFFLVVTMTLIVSVAFYQAFASVSKLPEYGVVSADPSLFLGYGAFLFGAFINEALLLTWIGFGIYLAGSIVLHQIRGSIKVWRSIITIIVLAFLYLPLREFSRILINPEASPITLVSQLLLGLTVTFIVVAIAYEYLRRHRRMRVRG